MSNIPYLIINDLAGMLDAAPQDSITSRTVYKDDHLKVILFVFAEGQSLSEHTAAVPAIIHILAGEATIELGGTSHLAQAGTWIHMQAQVPHGITARTPLTMLLTMLQQRVEVPGTSEA